MYPLLAIHHCLLSMDIGHIQFHFHDGMFINIIVSFSISLRAVMSTAIRPQTPKQKMTKSALVNSLCRPKPISLITISSVTIYILLYQSIDITNAGTSTICSYMTVVV
jgi:hypothetical protein